MKIPFVDLREQYNSIRTEIDTAIQEVIESCAFIRGKYVQDFELSFASYCCAKYCIGVANGTDALFIGLRALGVGRGDEVVVPANSFVATSEAVTMTGAKVVFTDCHPDTYNMEPTLIRSKINSKTKAIIPVHLYGQPADLGAICAIAEEHGLKIVQDCAQAHGAQIDGRHLSHYGDLLCFSFFPAKNLGAYGDAGAVVTNDGELAQKIAMYSNHGRVSKYDHEFEGINSRMDGLQAAILSVKLKYLPEWTAGRRRNASLYDGMLADVSGVVRPYRKEGLAHSYHLYVIRATDRDDLRAWLDKHNIASGVHYPIALPNLTAYRYLGHNPEDFPVASSYQSQILSLPMYPEMSPEMIGYVADTVKEFYSRKTIKSLK